MHHKTSFQLVGFFKAKNDCLSDNISVSLLDGIPVLFLPKERLFLQEKQECFPNCAMNVPLLSLNGVNSQETSLFSELVVTGSSYNLSKTRAESCRICSPKEIRGVNKAVTTQNSLLFLPAAL